MCKEFFDYLKEHDIDYRKENGNIIIDDELYLRHTNIETLPDNLVVNGDLDLTHTNIKTLPDNLVVVGWLDLSNTSIETLPDNLVVGSWLNLCCTKVKTLPDNLVIGSWLDLCCTKVKTLPDNLVVGGCIFNNNIIPEKEIRKKEKQDEHFVESKLSWRNGKYRVFDGIFCEVLEQRKNVIKVKIKNSIGYVVTDGINYSHGETIKEAKKDLIYKLSNRDTSAYEGWTLDTKITKKEAIESYRVITGACEFGTKNFVKSLENTPRKLTPAVVIKLTKGRYGHEKYKEYFEEG